MCLTEYDEEAAKKVFREDGYIEGKQEAKLEDARNFITEGDSPEKVARCTGLPLEEVQKLAEELATVKA